MATYPNEADPTDSVVLALDGTVDTRTGLPYIAKGVGPNSAPTYEIQYNRRLLHQNRILSALRAGMVVDEGSLAIGVYPINYTLDGVRKSFAGATAQAVTDNATRMLYIDQSNALQVQASYPTDLTTFLPLATVVAAAGSLGITDDRPSVMYGVSPVGVVAKTIPFAPSVFVGGALSVSVLATEWVAPFAFTLRNATGRVNTAPVGADLIVDVRVGGTSIFASQAEMMFIANGTNQDTSATKDYAVSAGDILTFEVEQVGSTTPGSDLMIVLNGLAAVVAA